jgi:hypothetical protein
VARRRTLNRGPELVPGPSEEARRVKIMNANWIAVAAGVDGDIELKIVTSDDRHQVVAASPAAMTALVALAQADTVLVWDPADRRLIAAFAGPDGGSWQRRRKESLNGKDRRQRERHA